MTAGKQLGRLTTHTHHPSPHTHTHARSGSVCSSFQYMKSQGTGRGKSLPTGCMAPTMQPIVLTTLATPVTVAPSCSCSQARLDSVCFITGSSTCTHSKRSTQICQFDSILKKLMNIVDTLYKIIKHSHSVVAAVRLIHSHGGTNNKGKG